MSCKKDIAVQNNGVIGKWKLVEQYDGYANGGTYTWNSVSTNYSNTITFFQNGQYIKKESYGGNFQECVGTFVILNANNLEINTNCNTVVENLKISELNSTTLIIDHQVIEGKIRYKYLATQ